LQDDIRKGPVARALLSRSDRKVIAAGFTELHYPLYWHYDVLAGLKAMAELGRIDDRRCAAARYSRPSKALALGNDYVDWGGTSKTRANEWISADALAVLHAAGRD
jgi:hypothetical protein